MKLLMPCPDAHILKQLEEPEDKSFSPTNEDEYTQATFYYAIQERPLPNSFETETICPIDTITIGEL